MAIKQLSYHTAFTPGSDLWIFSDKKTSFWTKKVDWYLNFQVSKPFPQTTLSAQQIKQLNEWGLPYFVLRKQNDSLNMVLKNEGIHSVVKTTKLTVQKQPQKMNNAGSFLGNQILMIGSEKFLPNTKTVILPFIKENLTSWLQEAYRVWKNIGCPSLRLFLPDHQYYAKIKDKWLSDQTQTQISIVEFKSQR